MSVNTTQQFAFAQGLEVITCMVFKLDEWDLLKIDVEGAELAVLKGLEKMYHK